MCCGQFRLISGAKRERNKALTQTNQKTDGQDRDGHYLKGISVPLRPVDMVPTALVIHGTNPVESHKQERSHNL